MQPKLARVATEQKGFGRKILRLVVLTPILLAALVIVFNQFSRPPANLGVHGGKLAPCPASPNCVCSLDADAGHFIEPLRYAKSPAEAIADLRKVLQNQKRAKIVTVKDNYLHAEFRSAVFRFVDDVEFLVQDGGVIQVRSASRLGYGDFGVNRRRVESIRKEFDRL